MSENKNYANRILKKLKYRINEENYFVKTVLKWRVFKLKIKDSMKKKSAKIDEFKNFEVLYFPRNWLKIGYLLVMPIPIRYVWKLHLKYFWKKRLFFDFGSKIKKIIKISKDASISVPFWAKLSTRFWRDYLKRSEQFYYPKKY